MNRKKVQHAFTTILFPLFLAVVIGALAGLGAVCFRWLICFEMDLFWQGGDGFLEQYQNAHWLWQLSIPVLVGLVMGPVLVYLAPEVRGAGVPEVMISLAQRDGIIRHRVTVIKSLVTATFIAAGASVGREGPIVQIGSSIGSSLTQLFGLGPEKRRLAIACGAAAGIAATFQAPMAGTLFVVEILLFDLEVTSLSNIVIAAVTGTVVAKGFWGDESLFDVPFFTVAHPSELGLYFILGLAAGLFSLVFIGLVFGLVRLWQKVNLPAWLVPAAAGLAVGICGLVVPRVLGVGYETVGSALTGELVLGSAALFLFAKLLLTGICTGSGIPGGIFAPSLFLGAMLGTIFGYTAQTVWPDIGLAPAHFALVGMGAMVSGTTLAPITAILTIFELTYDYEVVLPLMVACIPSLLVVKLLHGHSIYETSLLMRGIRLVRGHDVNQLRTMKVWEHMHRDFESLRRDTPIYEVVEKILASSFPHFIVVNEADELAGVLTLRDVRAQLQNEESSYAGMTAADLMQKDVVTIREDQNLEAAFHIFSEHKFSFLPVLDPQNPGRVTGYLKNSDLVTAYDQYVLRGQLPAEGTMLTKLSRKR